MNYTVIVAHIGKVYEGNNHRFAITSYNFYKNKANRNVVLFNRDKIIGEFNPSMSSKEITNESCI